MLVLLGWSLSQWGLSFRKGWTYIYIFRYVSSVEEAVHSEVLQLRLMDNVRSGEGVVSYFLRQYQLWRIDCALFYGLLRLDLARPLFGLVVNY
jgi:hypothetical protein